MTEASPMEMAMPAAVRPNPSVKERLITPLFQSSFGA